MSFTPVQMWPWKGNTLSSAAFTWCCTVAVWNFVFKPLGRSGTSGILIPGRDAAKRATADAQHKAFKHSM